MMRKLERLAVCMLLSVVVCVAQDVVSFIHGTSQESGSCHQNHRG